MPYRDTWATCEKCGKQFIFTVEEQRRLDEMGFDVEPTQCPECREKKELTAGQHRGVVKWYDAKKRYGFITMRSGEDVFFHRNGIVKGKEKEFAEDTPVSFRLNKTEKGPEAVDVALQEG